MLFAGKPQAEVQQNINGLMKAIFIFALIAVLIAGVVAFFISGQIAKLIINVSKTVHSVAEGDLTCEVEDAGLRIKNPRNLALITGFRGFLYIYSIILPAFFV